MLSPESIRWAIAMVSSIPRGSCSFNWWFVPFNVFLLCILMKDQPQELTKGTNRTALRVDFQCRPSGGCPGRQLWFGACDWAAVHGASRVEYGFHWNSTHLASHPRRFSFDLLIIVYSRFPGIRCPIASYVIAWCMGRNMWIWLEIKAQRSPQ